MTRSLALGPRPAAARRIAAALCLAVAGAMPLAAAAQQRQQPLVTIPPAPQLAGPTIPAGTPPPGFRPASRWLLPTRIQVLRDPQGAGIVMYGALTGKATSALAVLTGVFAYSQAFDPGPTLRLALADRDDRAAQALFAATVHGAPVLGVAVVALGGSGGDVSVFYDDAEAFPASFARLRQAFAESAGVGTTPLAPIRLGDASEIAIPQGWRVIAQGRGAVDLIGPQGEAMSLGVAAPVYSRDPGAGGAVLQAPCCDPIKALQAVFPQLAQAQQRFGLPAPQLVAIAGSQPAEAPIGGEGAYIVGKLSVGGRPYSWLALAHAMPAFTEPWTFRLSGVMAPQPVFAEELPTLLKIWGSHSINPPAFADRLRQAAQTLPTTQQILQATITARETAAYNADAGWDAVIRGFGTTQGSSADPHGQDDALAQTLADRLSGETGRPWRIVPASELK